MTITISLFLFAIGGLLFLFPEEINRKLYTFMLSAKAAFFVFGLATVWFLYSVYSLGAADFGEHKSLLFLLFSLVAVGSFFFVKEFLAIRGIAILGLLLSGELLALIELRGGIEKLLLATLIYCAIVCSLYFGVTPYRLRDFADWLFLRKLRYGMLSVFFTGYAIALIGSLVF